MSHQKLKIIATKVSKEDFYLMDMAQVPNFIESNLVMQYENNHMEGSSEKVSRTYLLIQNNVILKNFKSFCSVQKIYFCSLNKSCCCNLAPVTGFG